VEKSRKQGRESLEDGTEGFLFSWKIDKSFVVSFLEVSVDVWDRAKNIKCWIPTNSGVFLESHDPPSMRDEGSIGGFIMWAFYEVWNFPKFIKNKILTLKISNMETVEDTIIASVLGRTNLTDDEIHIIVRIFKYYDTDSDGHLTRDEATLMMNELGYVGAYWQVKRIPMEDFLLACGKQKKEMLEEREENEANALHSFRILDIPNTGTVNQYKLKTFLNDIDFEDLEDETIERLSELISSGDGTEFSGDDLYCYIVNNLVSERSERSF